jgi:hypothetical protein
MRNIPARSACFVKNREPVGDDPNGSGNAGVLKCKLKTPKRNLLDFALSYVSTKQQ